MSIVPIVPNSVLDALSTTACRGAPTEADVPLLTAHFAVSPRRLQAAIAEAFARGIDEADPGASLLASLNDILHLNPQGSRGR